MKKPGTTTRRSGTVRCAIYTRKSSEEGLEQEFNSLQAQREACEAFINSQRHEGWVCLRAAYDDGGFSGATMERPALQRLLADLAAGQVDTVVVYKIDRLTRSLADFDQTEQAEGRVSARYPRSSAREGELRLRRIHSLRFGRCAALDELLGKSPVAAAHVDPPLVRSGRQPIEKDLPHELTPGAHHAPVGYSIIEPNGLLDH